MSELRHAHAAQLRGAEEREREALGRLRIELTGSLAEQMASLQAQEKEKRLEMYAKKAARRMANACIIAGWTAWHDLYLEGMRQMQLLKAAAARLARPKLVATFNEWREDWEAEEQHKQERAHKSKVAGLAWQHKVLQDELKQVCRDARRAVARGWEESRMRATGKSRMRATRHAR